MTSVVVTRQSLLDIDAQAYVVPVTQGFDPAQLQYLNSIYPEIESTIKQRGFTGRASTSLILNGVHNKKPVYLFFLGIGSLDGTSISREGYRRAIGQLTRLCESHRLESIALTLPDPALVGISWRRLAQETTTILLKASYHFDQFITDPERTYTWDKTFTISANQETYGDVRDGSNEGIMIANAINKARLWCDMPPTRLTPTIFAGKAKELADTYGLKITTFTEPEIIKMGMGGLAGVSAGSEEECRLVVLEYKTDKPNAQTLAIVGKGITFDSGGLSIKPASGMETMKDDMAGAAVVIATMEVIAQIKPDVNVVCLAPMSENLPSGSATKPGDILKFYNGKTAEVLNTDAEGRLVLADALSYAVKQYKPDAMIDLATLTGACSHFLGPYYAGLMSQHEELVQKIQAAADSSGDRIWRLPMDNDYKKAVVSDIADLSNTGNAKYRAGAITASFFLQAFTGDVPWAHIDIAGTAFGVPDISYLRPGATGYGVRLLVDLIKNWK